MWMLILIPLVVVGMAGLLFGTDALDWGLARRRIRRSLAGGAAPDQVEQVVASQTDLLMRAHGADTP